MSPKTIIPPRIDISMYESQIIQAEKLPEVKPYTPRKLYNIPSSNRLNQILTPRHQADVLATVGTYNPGDPWQLKTTNETDYWGRMSNRFPREIPSTNLLGPGSYSKSDIYKTKAVGAPFKSTCKRFKIPRPSNIGPGSYETKCMPVNRGMYY